MPIEAAGVPCKLLCAWCETVLREGPSPASHGVCPECAQAVMDNRKWRAETSAPVGAGVGRTMRDSGVLSPASQRRGEMALLLPTTSDFDPLTLLELDIATKLCGLCGSPCERGAACICGAVTTSLGSCVDCGAEISAGQRCGGCLLGAGA